MKIKEMEEVIYITLLMKMTEKPSNLIQVEKLILFRNPIGPKG
jgi:hypothetical protein